MNTNASDIGLIGLAVMGQNLALNIADHGYTVSVFNRNPAKTTEFIAASRQTETDDGESTYTRETTIERDDDSSSSTTTTTTTTDD